VSNTKAKPRIKVRSQVSRPPLHKVILLNDDYTPRNSW
jgi:ATP-dependent Clp protease adaptor protein ClpS